MQNLNLKLLTLACAGLLSACASTPATTPKLASAQAMYQQAQNDPVMATSPIAQKNLFIAGEILAKAEKAETPETMDHYAYLAEQQARDALETAKRKAAEQSIEKLGKEKNEVVLQAREKEIARAHAESELARAEAEARAKEADARAREAEMALERVKQLEQQLSDLQATQTDRGLVLTLGDVLFATGKAELLGGAARNLDRLAQYLKDTPEKNILIEGHTDSVGGEDYNMELSRNRALSVRDALLDRGISAERMQTEGFGKSRPVASNDTETGRQQNRRVEIIILK